MLKPPPAFQVSDEGSSLGAQVRQTTAVVHAGAAVKFSLSEGSAVPMTLEDFTAEKHLTVGDIIKIRNKHGLACDQKREELLAKSPEAEYVSPQISVKEYGLDCVHFVLSYRLLRDDDFC